MPQCFEHARLLQETRTFLRRTQIRMEKFDGNRPLFEQEVFSPEHTGKPAAANFSHDPIIADGSANSMHLKCHTLPP